MGGQKFVMTTHDPETNVAMLTRTGGGGATIGRTKNAVIIGIWDKNVVMSDNKTQNAGDCSLNVEKVHKILTDFGYWAQQMNAHRINEEMVKIERNDETDKKLRARENKNEEESK